MTGLRRMARAGGAMAGATAISRITGFARTMIVVAALGMGSRLLDAYTAANVVPNMIYELVMGGAVAAVLVPLLVRIPQGHDRDVFGQRLLSAVVYGAGGLTLAAMAAAPAITDVLVPGFTADQRDLVVVLIRFFVPQILFYAIGATLSAILNVRGRFAVPMWAPIANNLVVIGTALVFIAVGGTTRLEDLSQGQMLLLAVGTSAGVVVQMMVLAMASRQAGLRLRLGWNVRGIGIRRIAAMAGWTIAAAAAAQAGFLVTIRLLSQAGEGMVGVYSNAYTLFQVPYAIIAVTVLTGLLPRMSRAAAARNLAQITDDLSRGLRLTSLLLAPIAAAMIVLGPTVTQLVFGSDSSALPAARRTGVVLGVYGLALLPFAVYQIMLRVFYALGDTRTPALLGTGVSATTIALGLLSAEVFHGSALLIALAGCTGVGYGLGAVTTAHLLRRRVGRVDGHRLLNSHLRITTAAVVSGAAAWMVITVLQPSIPALPLIGTVAMIGAILYFGAALLLRVREVTTATALVLRGVRAIW